MDVEPTDKQLYMLSKAALLMGQTGLYILNYSAFSLIMFSVLQISLHSWTSAVPADDNLTLR